MVVGIHQAYPYFKKKNKKDIVSLFIKISLGLLFLYFIISIIITFLFNVGLKVGAIILLTPFLVYNKIISYINMVETPNNKNSIEMMANILEVILVSLLWIYVPANLEIGIFILAIKDLFLCFVYTYKLRKAIFKPTHITIKILLEILKFGMFPMLSLLMTTLNYRVDIIMLNYFVTSTEVGIYSVGVMLAERVWLIPDALKEVMISNLAKGKGKEEVCFVIRICNIVCLFVVFGIILLGKPFINIFFGLEYSSAYLVTVVILIGVIFMVYYKMIGAFNIVYGKQKENFVYLVISVVCNIIANLIFIPIFGNIGAALASVISYGISAYLFIRRFTIDNQIELKELLLIKKSDINRVKLLIHK